MFTLLPKTTDKPNILMVMVTKIKVFTLCDFPLELKLKHNRYAGENIMQMSANKCKSKMI